MGGVGPDLAEGRIHRLPALFHVALGPGVVEEAAELLGVDDAVHHPRRNAAGAREGGVEKRVALALGLARLEHVDGGEHVDGLLIHVVLDPGDQRGHLLVRIGMPLGELPGQAADLRVVARHGQRRSEIPLPVERLGLGGEAVARRAADLAQHLAALAPAALHAV